MTQAFQQEWIDVAVAPEDAGDRLDRLLTRHVEHYSRARLKALIAEGAVTVNGATIGEGKYRVKPGDRLRLRLDVPEVPEDAPQGEAIPLSVVHEDEHLIVVDKPAGLVVHPGAGNWTGTLVNALVAHCGESLNAVGAAGRPGIVHRLDKETSGLLVAAKTERAHRGLAEQFAAHGRDGRLHRTYDALVWGAPERRVGTVDAPLIRSSANRLKMTVAKSGGRRAVTRYHIIESFGKVEAGFRVTHLACSLETGRTHQIRVHLAHIGHPLLGDPLYGAGYRASASRLPAGARAALEALGRQALHASRLGFVHPASGERLCFTSPLPAALERLVQGLRSER